MLKELLNDFANSAARWKRYKTDYNLGEITAYENVISLITGEEFKLLYVDECEIKGEQKAYVVVCKHGDARANFLVKL